MRLKVEEVAKRMETTPQTIRIMLQRGLLPFGTAVKMSSRWTYLIESERFEKYIRGEK